MTFCIRCRFLSYNCFIYHCKIRGFGEFPIPPTVMFAILAAIGFYTASGLTAEV